MPRSERPAAGAVSSRPESAVPLVNASDVARVALFLLLVPWAWSLSSRHWPALSRLLAGGWAKIRAFKDPRLRTLVSRAVGRRELAVPAPAVWRRTLANNIEFMLQLLKMSLPSLSRWQPDVDLVGREHIEECLRQGHGIILWVHRFRPFVHFVALRKAGFDVCRASGRYHGEFFRSRLGRYWLNPVQNAIEDRYCQRVIVRDHSFGHLRDLQQRLKRRDIVSMYADHLEGTRNIEVPFLAGRLSLSTQPISLAVQNDCRILPVFPVAEAPGRFLAIVEPGLDIMSESRAAVEEAIARHARRLEWYVLRYPDQWHGWWRVRTESGMI